MKSSSQIITTNKPTPIFIGRMPFLSPNQQCQKCSERTLSVYLSVSISHNGDSTENGSCVCVSVYVTTAENPPSKFRFSPDRRTLTVSSVCKVNCSGLNDRRNDLMTIQCNASNVHGYTLGSGFINVFGE